MHSIPTECDSIWDLFKNEVYNSRVEERENIGIILMNMILR